jgi:thiol-disulfide isomerase/thioredoxin
LYIFAAENDKSKSVYMMKKFYLCLIACLMAGIGVMQAQLPAVSLKTIDGAVVNSETLSNDGKPFIIDFFATWCKPCNRELSAIAEVYDEWQEETGVKIFAVSIDQAQNINKVKPLVENHGWEYEVLLDPNSDFKRALGIQMIPYVLIVDGKGNIVYKHNGYTDGAETELIEKVRELIK